MSKKLTRQQAINAHCRSCIFDSHEPGSWVMQVENCAIIQCELHEYRPLTTATRAEHQQERFDAMSPEEQAIFQAKSRKTSDRMARTRLASKSL